ncbi:MAG: hypothetical protein ACHQ9S_27205 [Candidatus Binatia bacterium]
MASSEALRRRVARLYDRETDELRAFMRAAAESDWPRLIAALRAAGYPLPKGDDPWSVPAPERQACTAKWRQWVEAARSTRADPRRESIVRRALVQLRADWLAAQNGSKWCD